MKRVYTLYRVSTTRQVDIIKDDIPMQRIACHDFADRFPDWEIVKEFEEKGISGYKVSAEDRDAIQDLKEAALNHEFDVLLVFMFDRLGRMENETPFVLQWFVEHGIEMWSVNEGQQKIESHGDKLMNYIRFWQASGESEKTSIRVKTRLRQMTEEGLYTGGAVSFGFHLVHKGRKNKKGQEMRDLEKDPVESEVVYRMYCWMAYEGYGSYQIAEMVNREGYRTHAGSLFQSNTVLRILRNPLNIGFICNGDARSERNEELRIVSDELFETVQRILDQRAKCNDDKRNIAMRTKGRALLSGNIFCGHCGCRLATSRYVEKYRRKDGTVSNVEYGRYVCYHRSRKLNDCDGATTYKADKIDSAVIELMRNIFSKISGCPEEDKIQSAYNKMMAANHAMQRTLEQNLEKSKKQLEVMRIEIGKVLAGDSIFTQEDLTLGLQKLKTDIAEYEEKLRQLKDEDLQKKEAANSVIPAYKQFKTWAEEFEDASFEAKKMIACQLIKRVEVRQGYILNIELNLTYQQFLEGWDATETIDAIA